MAEETPPRYCSSCRHELKPEDYLFCPNCGTPFMHPPPPPQPGAGAPGEPAQEQATQEQAAQGRAAQGQAAQGQAAQEQPAQRGWGRRHPILTGGLGIIVVLLLFIVVVASLGGGGGGGEENKKSTSGGTASTDGQILFRCYLDLELTKSAIFTMYPNGSHIRQITHPPALWGMGDLRGPPMGRRSPSIAGVAPRIARGAGSWSSTSTPALRAVSHTAYPMRDGLRSTRLHHRGIIALETPKTPSQPTESR